MAVVVPRDDPEAVRGPAVPEVRPVTVNCVVVTSPEFARVYPGSDDAFW